MPVVGLPAPLPGHGDEPVQFRLGAQALDQDLGGIAMIDCGTEVRRCLSAFKGSSVLKFVVASLWVFGSLVGNAKAQQEFIVTGDKIINSRVHQEFVRLSERIPISQLKRRFARYKITSTAGEDCLVCATVSRNAFQFEVHYDEDGIVVIGIYCRDSACVDALGNRVGGSLRQALGNEADCDAGDELTCESKRLTGLSYIVRENNKCTLRVTESGKNTGIPACARIAGFSIVKK